uniref:Uncharacterized protein n=1 Tax=Atrato Rhabdo-like virus 2 TaxID=2689334 RepID=A0A6B9KND8_9RHAB|nr:hypothetical protein [Atrato Rhabdo-like virus 2]
MEFLAQRAWTRSLSKLSESRWVTNEEYLEWLEYLARTFPPRGRVDVELGPKALPPFPKQGQT